MTRKSSIHFKPVSNVRFAVSHAERTDLSEPEYLLPEEYRLDNVVVAGSLSENEIAALFEKEKAGMTGQAKARKSSPFWEGVVVLDGIDAKKHTDALQKWKTEYEKTTGHKVLHMSVHLDEGYLDEKGKPQYNPHAHVIVSRMDSKNRIVILGRKQLGQVQDLTAETLQMQRGSTLKERKGMRGRTHVPHRQFREQAEEGRLDLDKEKSHSKTLGKMVVKHSNAAKELRSENDTLKAHIDGEPERLRVALLAEKYRLDREEYKRMNAEAVAAGLDKPISQKDYSDLKKAYESELTQLNEKVEKMEKSAIGKLEKIAELGKDVARATEKWTEKDYALTIALNDAAIAAIVTRKAVEKLDVLTTENAQLVDEAQKWKAKAEYYEAEKAKGTPPHLIDTMVIGTNKPKSSYAVAASASAAPTKPPKTPLAPIFSPSLGKSPLSSQKTPRQAFVALYGHLRNVLVGMIDGMRLDAADGRLGVFSQPNGRGSRIEVLCDVPLDKVMPAPGQLFDSRARPGQTKSKVPGI